MKRVAFYIAGIFIVGILVILLITTVKQQRKAHSETALEQTKAHSETALEQSIELIEDNEMDKTEVSRQDLEERFKDMQLGASYKKIGDGNPLITQEFGADPYGLTYEGRLYVYMTQDILMKNGDGTIADNNYSRINSLRVISTEDMVNWTDHGEVHVGGIKGATTWANNSWAPAIISKNIEGKDRFFLYFANSASSIGVLVSDSPTGPFVDPLGKPMITRETPNCKEVEWMFDPAVFTDDDGISYMCFGGGVPMGEEAMPNTARIIQLGEDMISTVGEAALIEAPYVFEDSGINKFNDTYYYSYCTNWNSREGSTAEIVPPIAEIAYMTSDSPMGPYTYQGTILKNPGVYFGVYGNNHHCITEFNGETYMLYHAFLLQASMGLKGGYRSTNINRVSILDDGTIEPAKMDKQGISQLKSMNPYQEVSFLTMANNAGIACHEEKKTAPKNPVVNTLGDIHSGDWVQVRGVDFTESPATQLTVNVHYADASSVGGIKVCLDSLDSVAIGYVAITNEQAPYSVTIDISETTGTHDVFFVFEGEDYRLLSWQFTK